MENGINFYDFSWASTMSYVFLLGIVSIVMFQLVKEKSFRHYFIYATFLLLYIATKHPTTDSFFDSILQPDSNKEISSNYNWWVQVVFYTFYTLFSYYILDLDVIKPKQVRFIRKFLYWQLAAGTVIFIIGLLSHKPLLTYFFLYWFMPIMLLLMFYFLPTAIKSPGNLKWVILLGIIFYISSALTALYFSFNEGVENPIVLFFTGIIVENICFSIGIAIKYRQIHHERAEKIQEVAKLAFDQKLSLLRGAAQGEQKERKRIAAELHDGLGNLTATALLQFEHAKKLNPSIGFNESYMKGIHLLEDISDDVRNIAHNLMPKTLTKLGLVGAINEIADHLDSPKISFIYDQPTYSLTENQSFVLFRMIQECINNIIKHAKADHVTISLSKEGDNLVVTIQDDGAGFNINKLSEGLGLQNLKSRAELIHGSCEIQSTLGKGTTTTIVSPIG